MYTRQIKHRKNIFEGFLILLVFAALVIIPLAAVVWFAVFVGIVCL